MDDIVKKIQGMSLTKANAEIAEYMLEHLDTIGLQTSTALSDAIGVSDSSVIRFIRKLGFRGYGEFRAAMNARMTRQYEQSQTDLSPGEKFTRSRSRLNQDSLIHDVSRYTLSNLEKSLSKLDADTIAQVTDIILSSQHRYVAGFRGTACCAQYMASKLVLLLPNVICMTHADATAIERIADISQQDCLIIYSFPYYSELHKVLMELARERNAKIILFTDRLTCPLASKADLVLVAHVDGLGFTNSYVAPLSISEVVLLSISSRGDQNANIRIRRLDDLMQKEKLY